MYNYSVKIRFDFTFSHACRNFNGNGKWEIGQPLISLSSYDHLYSASKEKERLNFKAKVKPWISFVAQTSNSFIFVFCIYRYVCTWRKTSEDEPHFIKNFLITPRSYLHWISITNANDNSSMYVLKASHHLKKQKGIPCPSLHYTLHCISHFSSTVTLYLIARHHSWYRQ
jgi:hypothetical protein